MKFKRSLSQPKNARILSVNVESFSVVWKGSCSINHTHWGKGIGKTFADNVKLTLHKQTYQTDLLISYINISLWSSKPSTNLSSPISLACYSRLEKSMEQRRGQGLPVTGLLILIFEHKLRAKITRDCPLNTFAVSEEVVCPVRTFYGKNFAFFEIYDVSARTRGLSQCGHFSNKGRGQFFAILCGHHLWTAPPTI